MGNYKGRGKLQLVIKRKLCEISDFRSGVKEVGFLWRCIVCLLLFTDVSRQPNLSIPQESSGSRGPFKMGQIQCFETLVKS